MLTHRKGLPSNYRHGSHLRRLSALTGKFTFRQTHAEEVRVPVSMEECGSHTHTQAHTNTHTD